MLPELHQDQRPRGERQCAPHLPGAPILANRGVQPEPAHLAERSGGLTDSWAGCGPRQVHPGALPGHHARAQRQGRGERGGQVAHIQLRGGRQD